MRVMNICLWIITCAEKSYDDIQVGFWDCIHTNNRPQTHGRVKIWIIQFKRPNIVCRGLENNSSRKAISNGSWICLLDWWVSSIGIIKRRFWWISLFSLFTSKHRSIKWIYVICKWIYGKSYFQRCGEH